MNVFIHKPPPGMVYLFITPAPRIVSSVLDSLKLCHWFYHYHARPFWYTFEVFKHVPTNTLPCLHFLFSIILHIRSCHAIFTECFMTTASK